LAAAASTRDPQRAQTRSIDARTTSSPSTTGAWSVDAYGRPLDHEGNVLQSPNPNTGSNAYNTTQTRSQPNARRPYPSPIQPNAKLSTLASNSIGSSQSLPSGGELSRLDASKDQSEFVQPKTAQPLFNGLLLISFVVNVYLIFWLKSLRVQFHDLVIAKRMANSNGTSTSSAA
jgi:hypothetical protein